MAQIRCEDCWYHTSGMAGDEWWDHCELAELDIHDDMPSWCPLQGEIAVEEGDEA